MIIKYNEYIKEGKEYYYDEFVKIVKEILPEINNITFNHINKKSYNTYIEIFCKDYLLFEVEVYSSITTFKNRDISKFNISKSFNTALLKKELKEYFSKYYYIDVLNNNHIYNNDKIILSKIPVLNQDEYSNYIYRLILSNMSYIKYFNDIKIYLNDNILNKLEHLYNANKFDLI